MNSLYIRIPLNFILIAFGIVLISALPGLFNGMMPDIQSYGSTLASLIDSLMHPSELVYPVGDRMVPVFPEIWSKWRYSLTLLAISFAIAFILALIASYITMLFSKKTRDKVTFFLNMLESIPDVFIIGLFTMMMIAIYRQTDIHLFHIIAFRDARIYFLPLVVLSILPALFFFRIMMHDFEEESTKSYVDLAKVKGLNRSELLFVHIFRNAVISFFTHAKSILWFMLSNLLLVEYVFNLSGLMYYMFENHTPEILALGLLMMFIPIFLVLSVGQIIIEKLTNTQIDI